MKQTLLSLLILFSGMHSLTSCVKKKTESGKPPVASLLKYDENFAAEYLDSLRTLDSSTTPAQTEVVLGFRFGMSEKDYKLHFDSLLKSGTIRRFPEKRYTFQIPSDPKNSSPDFEIQPSFVRGKLANVELQAWSDTLSATEMKVGLLSIYSKKYGPRIEANNASYWFLKNMEVQLITRQTKADSGTLLPERTVVLYRDNSQIESVSKKGHK